MDWGSIVIGFLIALLGYLANEVFSGIKDDLSDLKKKKTAANERLIRIESKEDQLQLQVDHLKNQALNVYGSIDTLKDQVQDMHQETRGALKIHGDDIAQTKNNFGRVLVILKGLVQKK
jgi:peptidoglycan hydrolase CwlO-like protein